MFNLRGLHDLLASLSDPASRLVVVRLSTPQNSGFFPAPVRRLAGSPSSHRNRPNSTCRRHESSLDAVGGFCSVRTRGRDFRNLSASS